MFKKIALVVAGLFASINAAFAASLLDTGMTTAVTGGLTDIEDTIGALLALVMGVVITVTVLRKLPGMVKSFISAATGK